MLLTFMVEIVLYGDSLLETTMPLPSRVAETTNFLFLFTSGTNDGRRPGGITGL